MPATPTAPSLPDANALVHPIYARLLRMLLQHADVDGNRVLAAAQLDWDSLIHDDRRLSRDTVTRLVGAALAATAKPWLGLDLGSQLPVSAHGALGYAAVTAPNLEKSLAMLARYGAIRHDTLAWSLQTTPTGVVLQAVERNPWGVARGFMLDTVLAAVLRVIEAALGQRPPGLQVDLPLPQPTWAAQYQRFAPVEVRFQQAALAFHVNTAALALPCIGADARAHASACRDCDQALVELAGRSLAQRVAALLTDAPAGHYPQLPDVAAACGLTPRTLMRHLQSEATSYQQLLTVARQERALQLLQGSALTVEEVAAQLGYVDTSNFSRTVRRWFGATPGELRRRR